MSFKKVTRWPLPWNTSLFGRCLTVFSASVWSASPWIVTTAVDPNPSFPRTKKRPDYRKCRLCWKCAATRFFRAVTSWDRSIAWLNIETSSNGTFRTETWVDRCVSGRGGCSWGGCTSWCTWEAVFGCRTASSCRRSSRRCRFGRWVSSCWFGRRARWPSTLPLGCSRRAPASFPDWRTTDAKRTGAFCGTEAPTSSWGSLSTVTTSVKWLRASTSIRTRGAWITCTNGVGFSTTSCTVKWWPWCFWPFGTAFIPDTTSPFCTRFSSFSSRSSFSRWRTKAGWSNNSTRTPFATSCSKSWASFTSPSFCLIVSCPSSSSSQASTCRSCGPRELRSLSFSERGLSGRSLWPPSWSPFQPTTKRRPIKMSYTWWSSRWNT